jgi:hypothetical protein
MAWIVPILSMPVWGSIQAEPQIAGGSSSITNRMVL